MVLGWAVGMFVSAWFHGRRQADGDLDDRVAVALASGVKKTSSDDPPPFGGLIVLAILIAILTGAGALAVHFGLLARPEGIVPMLGLIANSFFYVMGIFGFALAFFSILWKAGLREKTERKVNAFSRSVTNQQQLSGNVVESIITSIVLGIVVAVATIPIVLILLITDFLPVMLGTAVGVGLLSATFGWGAIGTLMVWAGYVTTAGLLVYELRVKWEEGSK